MLVYLAGPLTATDAYSVEQNIEQAAHVYFALIDNGISAFCPHLVGVHPEAWAISYERWLAYDCSLIDVCSHVLMLPRWTESPGACREHAHAKLKGKIILYDVSEIYD